MNKFISFIAFSMSVMIFMLTGCSTEEIETYNGVNSGIFIQQVYTTDPYGNPQTYRDSADYSFSNYAEDVTFLNTTVVIRTIGFTTDYDRPYKVEVVPEETTGIEGEDFEISQNTSVIKAGAATDNFYIRMLRTPKLRSQKVKVKIRVVPNEYFSVPISELKNSASWSTDGKFLSSTEYKVTFSEEYVLPWPFDIYWPDKFGTYSVSKLMIVNKVMGWTFGAWTDGTVVYGKLDFMAGETQKYLQKQADAGTPVIDEDGSYMQLGPNFRVNYNAYITDND